MYDGNTVDAALLQMVPLRLFPVDDPRLVSTVERTWKTLSHNGWLMRYHHDDGFGLPEVAFILCTFWLIEALAMMGREKEASALLDATRTITTPLGLLSEDYNTIEQRMTGNFPQAYSHVGLIRAAFAAAPRWRDVL
jgi:GH15 family glucan-1,4-alpha-glucosidase